MREARGQRERGEDERNENEKKVKFQGEARRERKGERRGEI